MHTLTGSIELYQPLIRSAGGWELQRQNSKSHQAVSHEGTEKTRDNLRVIAHVSVKFPRCTHTPGAMSTDLINVGLQGKLAF